MGGQDVSFERAVTFNTNQENDGTKPSDDTSNSKVKDNDDDHHIKNIIDSELAQNLLRNWVISNGISQRALAELLCVLTKAFDIKGLPKDARTFLCTKTLRNNTRSIREIGEGKYWHNGLRNSIASSLLNLDEKLTTLVLSFNIDGLPIYKSSKMEFWPILTKIVNLAYTDPVIIGIFCGDKKPDCNIFLSEFVDELNDCIQNGISTNGRLLKIKISCFICDTPARSFIKGIVSFNAYHGCQKCIAIGEYDKKGHHMTFPRLGLPPRTDLSFRNKEDPCHHKSESVLEKLPIDMVKDFVIADSLHLLDLGIMKKCLLGWTSGSFNFRTKWSGKDMESISTLLIQCNETIPTEIHRSVRKLDTLRYWKGLEFRTFLLYIGPVILKDFLPYDVYQHYLYLFCAIRICSSEKYYNKKFLDVARNLLIDYVENYILIYGIDSISSNVHNLSHLVDDVERFGILPLINAYPFENALFSIKNLLRHGNLPLSQAANRISEISSSYQQLKYSNRRENYKKYPYVDKPINNEETAYKKVYVEGYVLADNKKDCWFLTQSNEIVQMQHVKDQQSIIVYGYKLKKKNFFFEDPFRSSFLQIYSSDGILDENLEEFSLADISCKLVLLRYHDEKIFLPLLHTFH